MPDTRMRLPPATSAPEHVLRMPEPSMTIPTPATQSRDDAGVRLPSPGDIVVGLDIGGTKLTAGVVAGDGRVLAQRSAPSRTVEGPAPMIDRLVALARLATSIARSSRLSTTCCRHCAR